MYILKLEHTFSSAHQLTNAYDNKCNDSIHGHNWKVKVSIQVDKLINNMVIDFTKVKEIIDKLDHKNLNDILSFEPTAENIAEYLYNQIKDKVKQEEKFITIELFEGEKASITYTN